MTRAVLLCIALLFSTGCANLTSIYRYSDVQGRSGAVSRTTLIDSEQRAINTHVRHAFVVAPDGSFLRNQENGQPYREPYATICTEKSPDTFSAQSGSLSAGLELPRASGTLAAALAESAASIALRTQLTQAQAELLYRICEAHGNQAISGYEVHRQLRRFQNTMVALLAIEQLTGAVQVQNAALTQSGSATTDRAVIAAGRNLANARAAEERAAATLAELKQREAEAATTLTQAQQAVTDAEANNSTNLAALRTRRDEADRNKAGITARVSQAETAQTSARQARERAEAALAAAESGSASVSGSAVPLGTVPDRRPSEASMPAVADAVKAIVDIAVTGQQTTVELCHDILANEIAQQRDTAQRTIQVGVASRVTEQEKQDCWAFLRQVNVQAHQIDLLNAQARLALARAAEASASPDTPPPPAPAFTAPRQAR